MDEHRDKVIRPVLKHAHPVASHCQAAPGVAAPRNDRIAVHRENDVVAGGRDADNAPVGFGKQRCVIRRFDPEGFRERAWGDLCHRVGLEDRALHGRAVQLHLDDRVGGGLVPENDKDRPAGLQAQRYPRDLVCDVIDCGGLGVAGFGMPELGHLAGDAEARDEVGRSIGLVGQEVEVGLRAATVGEEDLVCIQTAQVRRGAQLAKDRGQVAALEDLPLTPQLSRQRTHLVVASREVPKARGPQRRCAEHGQPFLHERGDLLQEFWPHRFRGRQHQQPIAHLVGQDQASALDLGVAHQHVSVDVVKIVARRQRGALETGHLRRILADEIGHVGDVEPFLEQDRAAALILDPGLGLLEPGVVPVELGAKPGVHAGPAVFGRLVDIDMQDELVDALAEGPIAALLQTPRRAQEERPARERFREHGSHAIDMGGGRRVPQFDASQAAGLPKLAADLIAVTAVEQKLARETPVAIVFEPHLQTAFPAEIAQTADVIPRDQVRHQPSQIP